MLSFSDLSNSNSNYTNYDHTLDGWAQLTLVKNLTFGVQGLEYCDGWGSRYYIESYFKWTFDGDDEICYGWRQSSPDHNPTLIGEGTSSPNIWSNQQQIHIEFQNQTAAKAEVMIYDMMGRVVEQISNASELNLTFTFKQSGVYIVHVMNEAGGHSEKVVIQ